MPLDLSPCEVHIPTYQPTFDLTRQRFLPARTIPTVRELVKARQDERTMPPRSAFVNRMEDSLVRWKPPGSSYRGTTMAIEGTHPYQLPTAKFLSYNQGGDGTNNGGGSYMRDSFLQWWRGARTTREGDNGFGDTDSNDEDDEFSLIITEPAATARTLSAAPPKTPRATAIAEHDIPPPLDDPSQLYQSYYSKPIPPDYLSKRQYTLNNLQQQPSPRDPADWIKACFSSCTNM